LSLNIAKYVFHATANRSVYILTQKEVCRDIYIKGYF